ncbi:MAG: methylamine utilization protein [Rudaea sp.]
MASRRVDSVRSIALAVAIASGFVHAAQLEVRLAQRDGSGVADGVVAAYPIGRAVPAAPSAEIDPRGLSFVGQVVAVRTGTSVRFPNSDNVRHHVYSFSPAKTFELKLYSGDHASSVVFDKPGGVALGCNIHDWMLGYLYVVDTPYFAKTDRDGVVTLKGLPDGDYELRIWHPRLQAANEYLSERVTLDGELLRRDVAVALRPAEQPNHPPAGLELGLDARAGSVR